MPWNATLVVSERHVSLSKGSPCFAVRSVPGFPMPIVTQALFEVVSSHVFFCVVFV